MPSGRPRRVLLRTSRVKNAILTLVALVSVIPSFSVPAIAGTDRTFGGYECTDDCSGHKAGYEWAEQKGITSIDVCEGVVRRHPNRTSFSEGCMAYVEDPSRGADEDEDGDSIWP